MILSLVMLASIFVLGTTAAEASPYKDVKTSRWSYADIMYVTEKGLITGKTETTLAPRVGADFADNHFAKIGRY